MKEKCNVGHGGHLAFRMNPIGYGDPKLSIKSLEVNTVSSRPLYTKSISNIGNLWLCSAKFTVGKCCSNVV